MRGRVKETGCGQPLDIYLGLNRHSLAELVVYRTVLRSVVQELKVIDCTHRLIFLSSYDLFSRREKTTWLERL